MYVGSARNLYNRLSKYYHMYYLTERPYIIIKALAKYGMGKFYLVILEYTDKDRVLECEQKWMDSLNPIYNVAKIAGNTLGFKHSDATKEIMKLRSFKIPLEVYDIESKSSEMFTSIKETGDYLRVSVGSVRSYLDGLEKNENLIFRGKYKILPLNVIRKTRPEGSTIEVNNSNMVKPSTGFLVTDKNKGAPIMLKVIDIHNNQDTIYESIKGASEALDCDPKTLSRFVYESNGMSGKYFKDKYEIIPLSPLRSKETRERLSLASKWVKSTTNIKVEITDLENGTTTTYDSIKLAGQAIGVSYDTIRN